GFVQIPYHALLRQIAYKSEENGIEVALQDESYTSMCSFLDSEPIERHGRYKGRRICRGLFRSENGKVINADVNAAYNIIKKAFPKAFAEGIEDASLHPVRMAMCPMCE
ncbi:MAG: zinc ribbon domain-containing protein, partial [Candidatus Methanofastidiosia archaeon]